MRRSVSILKDRYRSSSVTELIALVWKALFKSERTLIYCVSLQEPDAIDRNGVDLAPIVKGELPELERARKQLERVPWEFMCDVYDGVKEFFVFKDAGNGTLGHISWLYYDGDPNQTLGLGPRECEVRFCLTLPEYRGRGLYPGALRAIQRYLKRRGYEKCFICVRDDNRSSIRGIEKSGFRLAGRTRLRKIFGFPIGGRRDTRYLKEA